MSVRRLLPKVAADLAALRRPFALVGGIAVGVRAAPRFTADVDVAVAVADDRDAEQLVFALTQRGYRIFRAFQPKEGGRLLTIRLLPPASYELELLVDLLFATSGIEPEAVAQAELLEVFPGVRVPVARREHLVAMKVLAHDEERRPQDRIDALNLIRLSSAQEIVAAEGLVRAIQQRGQAGGRDLLTKLREFVDIAHRS